MLENDNYVLKLEVVDTFGSLSAVEVEVSVTGRMKLGDYRLSFEDMTIPVAGIPLTIARTYDSLTASKSGDFGYGWRMEFRNADLRTSLPKSGLEDIGIFTPFKSGTPYSLRSQGVNDKGLPLLRKFTSCRASDLTASSCWPLRASRRIKVCARYRQEEAA
ncbi:MAG: DUF6531 domain-containing protein [Pirellulales bacterium]